MKKDWAAEIKLMARTPSGQGILLKFALALVLAVAAFFTSGKATLAAGLGAVVLTVFSIIEYYLRFEDEAVAVDRAGRYFEFEEQSMLVLDDDTGRPWISGNDLFAVLRTPRKDIPAKLLAVPSRHKRSDMADGHVMLSAEHVLALLRRLQSVDGRREARLLRYFEQAIDKQRAA